MDRRERARLKRLAKIESELRARGFSHIAGVDEVGRGCLAGPVFACACILPEGLLVEGIDDSKKVLPQKRAQIYQELINSGAIFALGSVDHEGIDQMNIYQASLKAMREAIKLLPVQPSYLLLDGVSLPGVEIPQEKIIGGDAKSLCIAAASIIAKESRDALMRSYHEVWPQYGFDQHKGYSTDQHITAIRTFGPSPIHRHSFHAKALQELSSSSIG